MHVTIIIYYCCSVCDYVHILVTQNKSTEAAMHITEKINFKNVQEERM